MLEIVVLIVLVGVIGKMARRRGRSPVLFGAALVVAWFAGEAAGAVAGVGLAAALWQGWAPRGLDGLLVYGMAMAGACIGAGLVFLLARLMGPVGGQWRELPANPAVSRSRLKGAIVGGVGGAAIGVLLVAGMFFGAGEPVDADGVTVIVFFILAISFVGSLLGLISGVDTKK